MKYILPILSLVFSTIFSFQTKAQVAANAGADKVVCSGQSVQLTGSVTGATGFEWIGSPATLSPLNSLTPNAAPIQTTAYYLRAFNGAAADTDTVVVSVKPSFTPPSPNCLTTSNNSVQFVWNAVSGVTYWVSINGGAFITPNGLPNTHTVTGLTAGQSVTIIVQADDGKSCSPSISLPVTCSAIPCAGFLVNPSPNAFICSNGEVNLLINPNISPYTAIWNGINLGQTSSFTVAAQTADQFVTVEVIDPNAAAGCPSYKHTFQVSSRPAPASDFVIDGFNYCEDSPFTVYYAYPITYPDPQFIWDFGTNNLSPNDAQGSSYDVIWHTAGNYPVSLQVVANNCTTEVVKNITIYAKPQADAGENTAICKGESHQLSAQVQGGTGVCSYEWLPNYAISNNKVLNPIVSPQQTTTYYLYAQCGGCEAIDSVTIFVNPKPVLLANTTFVQHCSGGGGSQLNVTAYQGVGAYSYHWSPINGLDDATIPNPVAAPQNTTIYTVYATDANNCPSQTATITVKVNPRPVANAGADRFICKGVQDGVFLSGSAANTGAGVLSYHWTPETGLSNPHLPNPYAAPDTTTIYKLVVTNLNTGCSSDLTGIDTAATVVVEVKNRPAVSAYYKDTVVLCKGESVQLGDAGGSGAGPNYVYEWTPGAGLSNPNIINPIATPSATTTFELKTFSNGCESVGSFVTVVVLPKPTLVADRSKTICPGDSVQLTAQIAGGQGTYAYQWSPTDGLSNPNALQPKASPSVTTNYTLTATASGCPSANTQEVTVVVRPAPAVRANPNNDRYVYCGKPNASIILPATINSNGAPVYYYWKPAKGLSDSTALNPEARPTETTVYTLVVSQGNCTFVDSIKIEAGASVDLKISGAKDTLCLGQTLNLTAQAGVGSATYLWTWLDPETGLTITQTGAVLTKKLISTTQFTLRAIEGACSDDTTFTVTVLPGAAPDFTFSDPEGCLGLSVSFINQSTGSVNAYRWDFGDGTGSDEAEPTHVYQTAGDYVVTLTVFSVSGCSFSKTVFVANVGASPLADFVSEPLFPAELFIPEAVVQFTDASPNPVSWYWRFGDSETSTLANPRHNFEREGEYYPTLTVVDASGCISTVEHGPYRVRLPEFFIPNVVTPNGDNLNETWRPVYIGSAKLTYSVFDRWGNRLYTGDNESEGWPAADFDAGVYFYIVELGERKFDGTVTVLK